MPLNVGIIGFGYWGTNLVRNFANLEDVDLRIVIDSRIERKEALANLCPTARFSSCANELLDDSEIDAVVIATPASTHFELAKKALENGKHVLIEKPMTSGIGEAVELIELATKKGKVL